MLNREYYDEFAEVYERERGKSYHQLIDDLEVELVSRYANRADVLEAGCGTGLLLERISRFAPSALGVDLSRGMLAKAHGKKLSVVQGSITHLPFAGNSFDVVCSFKVLAHVEPIREALAELARVTRPGGHLLLEFYNPLSLRYVVKRIKPATRIRGTTTDEHVFTRYDSIWAVKRYLPSDVVIESLRGVRIVTPLSHFHRVERLGRLLSRVERQLADLPLVRGLGGFLIVVARKMVPTPSATQ